MSAELVVIPLVAVGWVSTFAGGYLLGKAQRQPTRIVPVARKVDNRVVSKYTREERRAWKRRKR